MNESSGMETRTDRPRSPCAGECVIDPATGYCEGCFRTLREIALWPAMTPDEKRVVLAAAEERARASH